MTLKLPLELPLKLPLGPVMGDVVGLELTPEDIKRLQHPLMGGVIFFARNFESPEQLKRLTDSIHAIREPALLIAVDHEGGRVQRFREGFSIIPPMRKLGELWDQDPKRAADAATEIGFLFATELIAHGLDLTFAPVLDLDWGESGVIGNRAFHSKAKIVNALAGHLMRGMREAGMANVGKHFPGHGFVKADSHHEIPIDERTLTEIESDDMMPFEVLGRTGDMTGVMPAHVIYPKVDPYPAGFSSKWLKEILRDKIGFRGVIFSDDLSMEGASVAGGTVARAEAAFNAGCDMVLLCNDPARCDELLDGLVKLGYVATAQGGAHLLQMRALPSSTTSALPLARNQRYQAACTLLTDLNFDVK
jgi:beta-N-acetylhexosaminidase